MKSVQAVRHIVDKSDKSQRALADELGRAPAFVSSMLTRNTDPRLSTFASLAGACGYDLVLRGHDEEVTIDGGE